MVDMAEALLRLAAAVDGVLTAVAPMDAPVIVDQLRMVEAQRRRLAAAEHVLLAAAEQHGSVDLASVSRAGLLGAALRIGPVEARARVRAADLAGPRPQLTGAVLGPRFPVLTAAVRDGSVSGEHVTVIDQALRVLPTAVRDERADDVVATLTEHAQTFAPPVLRVLARRLVDALDPDGRLAVEDDALVRREVVLSVAADGSGRLRGRLTPECAATLRAVLDPLAAPRPADAGGHDARSPEQRLHDGLYDAATRLLRSGTLPESGGVPATVLVTMTLDQLQTKTGTAVTDHGQPLSVAAVLRLAAEAEIVPTVLDDVGSIRCFGRSRRLASTGQRRALAARDHGCSFPGCTRPPSWCQAHHVIAWADEGRTDLTNLVLLCGHHHRSFRRTGWTCRTVEDLPHWIPPAWLDPDQKPIRNTAHPPAA